MLHRTSSNRRRRASRSSGSSPLPRAPRSPGGTSPGRRASIAVSPVDSDRIPRNTLAPDMNRSPRHSIIPDISFDSRDSSSSEEAPSRSPRISPRGSLLPELPLSPRNSLLPDGSRSPRHSLVPGDYSRSPRNSLVPDSALSPRNSLVPDSVLSPRNSLVPDGFNRSPRNSLVPVHEYNRSPRHSLVPDTYSRSPRNSLLPDGSRSPRNELSSYNQDSPEEMPSRSPRHSIAPEYNRSPRGSIAPERTSPRGSIAIANDYDRSPRGSIAAENHNRSPRGSMGKTNVDANGRSPRGSLTLTFQDPPTTHTRRYSADNSSNGQQKGRSTSPYRANSKGAVNMGYHSASMLSDVGSRRASSSVSQVSGDEQRRLCSEQKKYVDEEQRLGMGISLTTYGSVAYQLKDANMEANSTCEFIFKALSIFNRTVVVTVILVVLSTVPLLMLIMGIQFIRDCPREPNIPIYMIVGGSVGCVKMAWVLYSQLHTRRLELSSRNNSSSIVSRIAALALTLFLIAWFCLGNYWIFRIKWPDYNPTLFEPNHWCHRTLYVFAIVHLYIMYAVIGTIVSLVIILGGCQLLGCPWLGPSTYK